MIAIYDPTTTDFSTNGYVALAPSTCDVTETINGDYQLQMTHPVDDAGTWQTIQEDCVLRVPSHRGLDEFRIYRNDKSISMLQTVYARHLTYDMVTDLVINRAPTNASAQAALDVALTDTGFSGTSNVAGTNSARWVRKNPLACIMGDDDNSIVNRWGGEAQRQGRRIDVLARLGRDNGVSIRYRKNLTGLDLSVDLSGVVTRIMPTGLKEDGQTVLEIPETFVDSPLIGNYAKVRTQHLHYGHIKVGDDYPTEADAIEALRAQAKAEFDAGIDKPAVSAKVSFVDLSQTVEYAEYRQLEKVELGDTIHIWHSGLGVDMTARVVSVTWDCLLERYKQITLGQEGVNLAAVINRQNRQISQAATERADGLQQAIDDATATLLSPGESYVRFFPSLSNPSEILIMDAPDATDAVNVMRLNRNGWGLSTTGANGPFTVAATAAGLVASAITTGVIDAALIKIMGSDGTFWDNNYIQITDQANSNRIMRYGLYDGMNSGLAFSSDGGVTWHTAVNFDGITVGSVSADNVTAGTLNAALIRIMGSDGTFWNDNYIQITDRTNPNRIMRYGRYDGVNSGLAFSTDGGNSWGVAIDFNGAKFGDSIAGFNITANGFTSTSGNVQIRPNGNFKFGSIEMNTTDFSPLTRFICWNGSQETFSVLGQTTQVFGYLVLSGLPTTSNKPNLYIDNNGTVYRSTYSG